MTPQFPEVELMIVQLAEAGWVRVHSTIWRSPSGEFFRGPFGAWKAMTK